MIQSIHGDLTCQHFIFTLVQETKTNRYLLRGPLGPPLDDLHQTTDILDIFSRPAPLEQLIYFK